MILIHCLSIILPCVFIYSNVLISLGPKQTISHYHETLGEALQGTELEFSGLEIEFKGEFSSSYYHLPFYKNINCFDTNYIKRCHQNLFVTENVKKHEFCSVILDEIKLKSFMYAVNNHYWYQMYIDDLPIWGKKCICLKAIFSLHHNV